MWLPILVCVFVRAITSNIVSDQSSVFRKCCPNDQSLVKRSNTGMSSYERYECNSEIILLNHNVLNSPLIVSDNIVITHGIPECDELQMLNMVEAEKDLTMSKDQCYDRLAMEIRNDTVLKNIPKTVELICIRNESENTPKSQLKINHIKKCCPAGHVYDTNHHFCRNINADDNKKWLNEQLNTTDRYIYEIENGLHCKLDEYAAELLEEVFSLNVKGSTLEVVKKSNGRSWNVPQGEWCLDHQYTGSKLVARVCTRDCAAYEAYCLRKCCPVGQHYRVRRCGSLVSLCVPTTEDDVSFDISSYLDPLRSDNDDFEDTLGIRSDLLCSEGRFVVNRTDEKDRHWLTREGELKMITGEVTGDYCLEAFDRRRCGYGVSLTAVKCFVQLPAVKNFSISFVMNSISSVCLALTLLVYCTLPELRNLHGRTLICHVSMMLLACSCLARVQYGRVSDRKVCTLLGYGIYFGFVAAFVWLNVMCFDIWWTFGSVRTVHELRKGSAERRRFMWYSLYAWSVVTIFTLTTYLLDVYPLTDFLDANMGKGLCWFGSLQNTQTDWPHYIFFVIPMGLMTVTNFILWVLTARHCARVKSEVHRLQAGSVGDRAKQRFRIDKTKYVLTGKLWVVMGAGWVSELLSTIASDPKWLWTIIDLFNELQGVFIFLILVCKPKHYRLIKKKLGFTRRPIETRLEKPEAQKNGTSSSSARTSSTILSRTISSDERNNLRISLPNNPKQS